ncbi:MAG: hypothetical protein ACO33A_06645 [Hyphomonas sp.]
MKKVMGVAAVALAGMLAACATSAPATQYANPVEACEARPTIAERDACMKNVVADVATAVKRESKRKPPR